MQRVINLSSILSLKNMTRFLVIVKNKYSICTCEILYKSLYLIACNLENVNIYFVCYMNFH